MHKTIQLDGIEVRKRAIRFLFARKRYNLWYDQGRVQPGESDMVDEWLAANYGWGEPTELQPSAGPSDVEDDCSPSDGPVRIIDDRDGGEETEESEGGDHEDPPMVTEEGAALSSDAATGSSPTLSAPKSEAKGKCGGNGRMVEYYHDLLVNDKADGHVQNDLQQLADENSSQLSKRRDSNSYSLHLHLHSM